MSFNNNFPNGYPTQPFPNNLSNPPPSAGPSNSGSMNTAPASSSSGDAPAALPGDPRFDIFEWYPAYQSCQRYFLDHAQYEGQVQAVAAFINIRLPFQWSTNPLVNSQAGSAATGPGAYLAPWQRGLTGGAQSRSPGQPAPAWVSLLPFIRRLVVTGWDREGIMHGFFGDDWRKGVGPMQECERRNYLFLAKGIGMSRTKLQYDMNPHETVPYLKPLENVSEAEIQSAEKSWSGWLSMEDWMLGERAPDRMQQDRNHDDSVSPRS